jgi:hypothetical protein
VGISWVVVGMVGRAERSPGLRVALGGVVTLGGYIS